MKPLIFVGRALEDLKAFPLDARRDIGFQLDRIQRGRDPLDWKPMTTIGTGVREIRYRDATGAFRVIYVARFEEAIYVLHAFQKKSQQTSKRDLMIAQQRLSAITERDE